MTDEPTRDELLDMLHDNLSAWEDEEESVKDEHDDLIERTRAMIERAAFQARLAERVAKRHADEARDYD